MTRQATDQLYIDLGYFTPEEYFTYEAEAELTTSSSASMSATVGVIRENSAVLEVTASIAVTISHIEGADLFAFTDAELALQADRIRETNVQVSSQFDLAVDYIKLVQADSFESAMFSVDLVFDRSRATSMETQAAFSLTSSTELFKEFTATIQSTLVQTTQVSRIIVADAAITSSSALSVSSIKTKEFAAELTSAFTPTLDIEIVKNSFAVLDSISSMAVTAGRITGFIKPYEVTDFEYAVISTERSKFGSKSLLFKAKENSGGLTGIVATSTKLIGFQYQDFSAFAQWESFDGHYWYKTSNSLTITYNDIVNTKYFPQTNTIFVFGSIEMYVSKDNGVSWIKYTYPLNHRFNNAIYSVNDGKYIFSGQYALYTGVVYGWDFENNTTWGGFGWQASGGSATKYTAVLQISGYSSRPLLGVGLEFSTISDNVYSQTTSGGNDAATNGTIIVKVGPSGSIQTSTMSAKTWTTRTSNTTNNLTHIVYQNNKFVATGENGTVVYSSNGIDWTVVSLNTTASLQSVVYFNNKWYVVGEYGNYGIWESSNLYVWTYTDIISKYIHNPKLTYFTQDKFSSWRTIDFWLYVEALNNGLTAEPVFVIQGTGWSLQVEDRYSQGLGVRPIYRQTASTYAPTPYPLLDTWNHFRITRDSGTVSIFVNGQRVSTGTGFPTNLTSPNNLIINDGQSLYSRSNVYLDELYITDQVLTPTSATTYTVPTQPYNPNSGNYLLEHWDTPLVDLDYTTLADFTVLSGKILSTSGQLTSISTTSATASRIKSAVSTISTTAQVQAQLGLIKRTSSNFASISTQLTAVARISDFFINADVRANLTADAELRTTTSADLSANTEFAASAQAVLRPITDLTLTATASTQAQVQATTQANISAASALTADISLIRSAKISTESISTQLTAVARVAAFFINSDVESSLTADAILITDTHIELNSTATTTIDARRLRSTPTAIDSVTAINVIAQSTRTTSAAFISTSQLTAQVQEIDDFIVNLTAVTNMSVAATVQGEIDVHLLAVTEQTAQADRIRNTLANITAVTDLNIRPGATIETSADLVVQAFSMQIITVVHIDPELIYRIPAETRTYKISPEQRDYKIINERRTYII